MARFLQASVFLAASPDMSANAPDPVAHAPRQDEALVEMSDPDGEFGFAIPKADFPGIATLEVGPDRARAGEAPSRDSAIPVGARDKERARVA